MATSTSTVSGFPAGDKIRSPGTEDSNDVWLSDDTGYIGYDYGINWDGGMSYGRKDRRARTTSTMFILSIRMVTSATATTIISRIPTDNRILLE